jgi:release factor glutamine methyltransferase
MPPETLSEVILSVRRRLARAGIESAALDARLIVQHAAGLTHEEVIASPQKRLGPRQKSRVERFAARREAGEPVSRLTGEREFYGRRFCLGRRTLDPRPETETLVDTALALLRMQAADGAGLLIADIGTGTGAIAISLLAELPRARAVASDISQSALNTAMKNSLRHKVADRVRFARSSWFRNIEGVFDLVVSNPPYLRTGEISSLAPEVRRHDPIKALDGGPDGLDAYREIAKAVEGHLRMGGHVCLEIGQGQEKEVSRIMAEAGFNPACKIRHATPDLAGISRVLTFVKGRASQGTRRQKNQLESVA